MPRTLIFLLALFIVGLCSIDARACSCAGPGAPCQEYWEATAVFIGTVIEGKLVTVKEGDYEHQQRAVRISIDEAFRGVEGAEVEVITGLGDADCGFGFRRAQQFLVYAYRSESDQKLHTNICTRTRAISEADPDLVYIRGLSKAKDGGTISGTVVRNRRNETGGSNGEPLAGVKVTIDGPQKAEAVTDEKGEFKIEGIQPGEYTVVPAAPKGLATRGPDEKVKVADRGCAAVHLWLESNARISGRVLNAQGLSVAKAEIVLIQADKERYQGYADYAYADEDGAYSFKLIPEGRYVLQMRYDGMSSQNRPFPVMYYPGTPDKSQAQVFTIKEGETIDLDIKVPPLPSEVEIRGQVVWPDGKPATTANVGYMVPKDSVFYGIKVDEQGRFSFKAYEGLPFGVSASVEVTKGKFANAHSGPIVAGLNTEPIKLVLAPPSP
ncbi:MAG TPA: carboxypeptidase regulatory-like domain-containing protein [Pyrinomonadaceae bacterium]